jgi:hypothetical protein
MTANVCDTRGKWKVAFKMLTPSLVTSESYTRAIIYPALRKTLHSVCRSTRQSKALLPYPTMFGKVIRLRFERQEHYIYDVHHNCCAYLVPAFALPSLHIPPPLISIFPSHITFTPLLNNINHLRHDIMRV